MNCLRLEINVSYPFLMQVYKDYDNGILIKNDFLALLQVLQSYVWRRFITGLPTNALNKIFMSLYEKIDKNNYLFSFQKALIIKKGVQRFPSDKEVKEVLKTKDMYNIKSKNRMYFFEKLENYNNKEKVFIDGNKDITIEHIFPQSPDSKWKLDLSGEDYSKLKDEYLNTVGNLTLSGNNGKLGNKSFIEKKKLKDYGYIDSRLWLNRYLSEIDKWGIDQLNSRFNIICDRLLKIWEYPIINIEEEIDNEEVNIFNAETPTHKKLEYAIFFDKKLYISEVSKLYVEVIKQLFDLQPETFFNSELSDKIGLSKDSSIIRSPSAINDLYYIENNLDNNGKFERIKLALSVFGIEDELVIKYSDS